MLEIILRPFQPEDHACLRTMLFHAIYVAPGVSPPPPDIVDVPEIAGYIDKFGQRSGDVGVMAFEEEVCVGAAWVRLMQGYGFIADSIPELSIAIAPGYRGQGLGSLLLEHLLTALTPQFDQVSLSVSEENPAKRLYERIGFKTWSVVDGTATMLLALPAAHLP